ncbi:Uncharacterised protein [Burkholderia pseudomallei]|nr:Uncharacterised protein [Burkholderia pseudomallei]CAJ3601270.1 Uncharacterised protein [Burkholderia pseudomallei]CAJ3648276.1 Uncharacterised protein [Burkholderia pseudomallei]CAJ3709270.1 Uncharacterised protein [Burkholderia pseudomallei]CAJ3753704.1 Uncharacterised protein [Burkholderia pseudomallei]
MVAFSNKVRNRHTEPVKGGLKEVDTAVRLQEQDKITPSRQPIMVGMKTNVMWNAANTT